MIIKIFLHNIMLLLMLSVNDNINTSNNDFISVGISTKDKMALHPRVKLITLPLCHTTMSLVICSMPITIAARSHVCDIRF